MHKPGTLRTRLRQEGFLIVLLVPALVYFSVYHLVPMAGMVLAFQDFRIVGPSQWVGLKHFRLLFSSPSFLGVLKNTLIISSMKIILFFPLPIAFALMLNELRSVFVRKFVQATAYLPHFLSWVVIAGVWISFLSPSTGGANQARGLLGLPPVDYMTSKSAIRWVLFASETWRSLGWDSIIYLAALMRISPSLYESADMDGAGPLQKAVYITIPELAPTMITVLILNLGFFMSAGFDQVFNMMNDSVISAVDILDTYVYRIGLLNMQYSFSTAASLFKGVIGLVLILGTHTAAKKVTGKGLW
ncbi:MAG: ABC transporter permease subunit [Spirochaetes bacterium]|nr:ABC transporter permease subunit [Spirochaetota bacterium]MBU1082291.1 ABC transporter permease subunit [Spirochaetota bacterium]